MSRHRRDCRCFRCDPENLARARRARRRSSANPRRRLLKGVPEAELLRIKRAALAVLTTPHAGQRAISRAQREYLQASVELEALKDAESNPIPGARYRWKHLPGGRMQRLAFPAGRRQRGQVPLEVTEAIPEVNPNRGPQIVATKLIRVLTPSPYSWRAGDRVTIDGVPHVVAAGVNVESAGPFVQADWAARGLVGMLSLRRPRGRKERIAYVWRDGRVTF